MNGVTDLKLLLISSILNLFKLLLMNNINDVIKSNLCLGCGICSLNLFENDEKVKMKYSKMRGHDIPLIKDTKSKNSSLGFSVCPGTGYSIKSLGVRYKLGDNYDKDLGFFYHTGVITGNVKEISQNASSTGIMTLFAYYLIKNKIVDKAIVTKFEYTKKGPKPLTIITDKKEDLIEAQGSKYCPVDLSSIINELKNHQNMKFVFIGTPCQIAGLRSIQSNFHNLGIVYFVGNFCGGFKSNNNLTRLIKINKINPKDVTFFRFRGGGQPGSMKIESVRKNIEIPYPKYVWTTGYSKLKRCHFCVDATAEIADISCGDAWLPKYQSTNTPTSIVVLRNLNAKIIIDEMVNEGLINYSAIDYNEVLKSQEPNIKSKKYRQVGRLHLYKKLGIKVPDIKEGIHFEENKNLRLEFNIFVSHKVKFIFEKLGLFYTFYYKNNFLRKIMFKFFYDNHN
jgi:coenzyme F420 hydrogenase subunit beta